jgi:predicted O-methyltransferase YrrM
MRLAQQPARTAALPKDNDMYADDLNVRARKWGGTLRRLTRPLGLGNDSAAWRRFLARESTRLDRESRVLRAAMEVRTHAPRSLEAALEYAYRARPASFKIAPIQVRSELGDFLRFVERLRPRAVLEIGTARGGTLFLLTRVAAPDAALVSIDLSSNNDLRFGGGDVRRRRGLFEAFALDRQRVHFLVGDSQTVEMRDRVERTLAGGQIDLLFIDGDHTPEGVRRDFELYRDLVRPGGVIAFHDIVDGTPAFVGGVPEFWRTIKTRDALEFIADSRQGGYGIGVLTR